MKITADKLWKVAIIESDRFRGQEILDVAFYDDEEEAIESARAVNYRRDFVGPVPETYIYAEVTKV
jgi:hypothetical protein